MLENEVLASIKSLDTPITRANLLDMSDEQIQAHVASLQERRLKSYNIYVAGVKLKEEAKEKKNVAALDKKLDQFVKKHESVVKALEVLDKYAIDIQALRLVLGDNIGNLEG
jgi:hypothetical protein